MCNFSYIVVVPIYNEESNIDHLLNSILSDFIYTHDKCMKIVFIDDGSTDESNQKLTKYLNSFSKFLLVNHNSNIGYGGALKTAINRYKNDADYLVFIDSDLTNPLSDIRKIFKYMEKKIDFIQANRYLGDVSKFSKKRKFIGILGNFLCKIFMRMKINDYTNGFRAVRSDLYNNINIIENDFSIIMEEKFKLKKYLKTISEFPTTLSARDSSLKTSSFNYSLPLIFKYLYYCLMSISVINSSINKID